VVYWSWRVSDQNIAGCSAHVEGRLPPIRVAEVRDAYAFIEDVYDRVAASQTTGVEDLRILRPPRVAGFAAFARRP
jgi:hypothetical protein